MPRKPLAFGALGVSEDPAELLARKAENMSDEYSIVNCESCGSPGIPADLTDGVCEDCLPEFREAQKDSEIKLLRHELARMLSWHDVVCDTCPEIVSPYHIQDTRAVAGATP